MAESSGSGAGGGSGKRTTKKRSGGRSKRSAGSESSGSGGASASRMVCDYTPGEECRVAVIRNGKLDELYTETPGSESIIGNIYVGRVANVERSIQAAFVDFGMGENGFLHVSDLHPQYFPGGESGSTTEQIGQKTPRRERPPIEQCLKRGQKILVQVLKENISTKGPTLTSYLSIPGRFLVMLPDMDKVGVSRKVEDEDDRREMRKVLDTLEMPDEFGFILRTAGVGKTKTELKRDLAYLQRLWKDIDGRLKKGDKPRLLFAESDLLMRALRDIWTNDIDEIIINDDGALKRAHGFMRIVAPRSKTTLLRYDRPTPVFHAFGIEEQIELIHAREVPLASGGSLVIDEAEAMVAIDVNSGKSRSHGDAETTAYRTNQEAVDEICRQLKLRDIGGLIMLDLIDMSKRSNRKSIEQRMADNLKLDRASTKPLPISQFGIMEMTRQRVRNSFRNQHFVRQTIGNGRFWVRRPESVAAAALREIAALLSRDRVGSVEMVVSSKVAGAMLSELRFSLTRLEVRTGKKIVVRVSETIASDRVTFYAYDENGSDVEIEKLPRFKEPRNLKEYDPERSRDAERSESSVGGLTEADLVKPSGVGGDEPLSFEAAMAEMDEEGAEEESSEGSDGRRRRRRRRRGRGGAGDGEGGEEAGRESGDDPAEDGEGGGRRRRRRDSRRGEGETEVKPAAFDPDSAEARAARKAALVALAEEHGETAPSGYPWRGDSWDLEPSALTMAKSGEGFADEANAELAERLREEGHSLDRAPKTHSGTSGGSGSSGGSGGGDEGDDEGGDEDGPRDGGGKKRRRRRRRGGRGRGGAGEGEGEVAGTSGETDGGERESSSAASGDVDEGDGDGEGQRRGRRRRGGRKRSGRREGGEGESEGGSERSSEPVAAAAENEPSDDGAPASRSAGGSRGRGSGGDEEGEASVRPASSVRRVNTRRKKKVAPKGLLSATGASEASGGDAEAAPDGGEASAPVKKKRSGKKRSTKKRAASRRASSSGE